MNTQEKGSYVDGDRGWSNRTASQAMPRICQRPPETRKRTRKDLPLESLGELGPADTSISDF